MYYVTLKFRTDQAQDWVVKKEFNNKKHCDNFISGVCKRKNYTLDELWEDEPLFVKKDEVGYIVNFNQNK